MAGFPVYQLVDLHQTAVCLPHPGHREIQVLPAAEGNLSVVLLANHLTHQGRQDTRWRHSGANAPVSKAVGSLVVRHRERQDIPRLPRQARQVLPENLVPPWVE